METGNSKHTRTSMLRQRAEALLKEHHKKENLTSAEADMLKLIHELKDNQIELELQNEKLKSGKSGAQETIFDISERKLTEDALRESEQKLVSILDDVSDIIWSLSLPDMKVNFISPSVEKIFGRPVKEFIENTALWSEIVHPDDKQISDKAFEQATEKGSAVRECRIIRPDGSVVWISDKSKIIYDKTGTPNRIDGVSRDITERKKAEQALRESEEKYRLLTENTADVIWVLNITTGKYAYISPSVFRLRGFTAEEAMNERLEDSLTPDSVEIVKDAIAKNIKIFLEHPELSNSYINEIQQYCKNGKVIWVEVSTQFLYGSTGDIEVLGVSRNIEERKKAEEELRKSEEHIRLLLNSTAEAIYGIDLDGNCTFSNSSCLKLLGYTTVDELLGKNMHQQIHHKHANGTQYDVKDCPIFKAFKNGVGAHFANEVFWRADGTSFPVEYWSYPQYHHGEIVGAVVTFLDITDRKKAEEALRESEETYRSILLASPDDITITDLEGRILMVSPATLHILRCKDENELIGHFVDEFIFQDDRERAKNNITLMFQGIMTGLGTYRGLRADGSIFEMEANAEFIRDASGQPNKILFIVRDITDRKKIEIALLASEEKHRVLFESSPDAYLTIQNGIYNDCNKAAENLLFGTRQQIIGQSPDALSPEFQPNGELSKNAAANRMAQAIESGFISFEWVHRRFDGSDFLAEISTGVIQIDGQAALFTVMRDITKRKKIEEALRESEEKFRTIADTSPLAIYMSTGIEQKAEYVNQTFIKKFGYTMEEVPTVKEWWPLAYPDKEYRHQVAAEWQKRISIAVENHSEIEPMDTVVTCKDGSLKNIQWGYKAIGKQNWAFGLDLTERIHAETENQKIQKLLEDSQRIGKIGGWEYNIDNMELKWTKEMYNIHEVDLTFNPSVDKRVQFYTAESLSAVNTAMQRAIEQGESYEVDSEIITAKGNRRSVKAIGKADLENRRVFGLFQDITERKRAEDELLKTNLYLENLINYANAPIIVWDPQFRITRFNHAFEFLTGRTEAEILGKSLDILFPPELSENSMALIHKTLTGERWKTVEIKIQHLDKSVRTLLWNSATLFMPDGVTPIATIAQGQDITERKLTEEALAQSRSELKAIYEFSPVMMCLVDSDRRIIFANHAFTALTGTEEEQLKGGHACGVFGCINAMDDVRGCGFGHNCSNCSLRLAMDDTLKYGTAHINVDYQTTLTRNGETQKVSLLGSTVLIENNNQRNLLLCLNNITERKQMEEKLLESSTRLVLATRAGGVGIWDYDIVNNVLEWDDQMFSLYGIAKSQFGGAYEAWLSGVHPDSKAQGDTEFQLALSGEKEFNTEFKVLWPDGSVHDIRALAIVVRSNTGNPLRMIGTNWDITQQKKTEAEIKQRNEELRELNATKDKFFSIIAHDLKSPFNSIVGLSEILVEQINEKEYDGIEKYASIILQSSLRAMNLLMNLMEWSRSQTGRMEFSPHLFDLKEFINDIASMFDDIALHKGIVIKRELPANVILFADKDMINTVLRNLISNAIKFTNQGGEIIVSVNEEKDKLMVSVKDNGIGIPKDVIGKLFRIDENYSTRGTANEAGTGLGLMLCKEFIEKHDGEIWVESEVEKGSTFYFTLPHNIL